MRRFGKALTAAVIVCGFGTCGGVRADVIASIGLSGNASAVLEHYSDSGADLGQFASLSKTVVGMVGAPNGNLYVLGQDASGFGALYQFNGSTGALLNSYDLGSAGVLANTGQFAITSNGNVLVGSTHTTGNSQTGVLEFNGSTLAYMGDTGVFGHTPTNGPAFPVVAVAPDGDVLVQPEPVGTRRYTFQPGNPVDILTLDNSFVSSATGKIEFNGSNPDFYVRVGGSHIDQYSGTTGNLLGTYMTFNTNGGLGMEDFVFGGGSVFVALYNGGDVPRLSRYDAATGTFLNDVATFPVNRNQFSVAYLAPEPGTLALAAAGLGMLVTRRRRG
ncbi:MAG: PEP-CTERM sorting domain-containing protein [Phycisphaerae bacterium]